MHEEEAAGLFKIFVWVGVLKVRMMSLDDACFISLLNFEFKFSLPIWIKNPFEIRFV